jgi:hypothetical protein
LKLCDQPPVFSGSGIREPEVVCLGCVIRSRNLTELQDFVHFSSYLDKNNSSNWSHPKGKKSANYRRSYDLPGFITWSFPDRERLFLCDQLMLSPPILSQNRPLRGLLRTNLSKQSPIGGEQLLILMIFARFNYRRSFSYISHIKERT